LAFGGYLNLLDVIEGYQLTKEPEWQILVTKLSCQRNTSRWIVRKHFHTAEGIFRRRV
jgi:hypothetical protein